MPLGGWMIVNLTGMEMLEFFMPSSSSASTLI
jgi:hypothetical protein